MKNPLRILKIKQYGKSKMKVMMNIAKDQDLVKKLEYVERLIM